MSIALLKLTRPNGSLLWLNPLSVAALTEESEKAVSVTKGKPNHQRVTRVHLQSGEVFDVLELHDDPAWNTPVRWNLAQ